MPYETKHLSARYPEGGASYTSYYYSQQWERSPRVNGKLVLRPNPWSLTVRSAKCTNSHAGGPAPYVYVGSFHYTTNEPEIQRAKAIAQSDLRGQVARKLKNKEIAALGVSAAQAGKAIHMLRGSGDSLVKVLGAAEHFYRTTQGRNRLKRLRRLVRRGGVPTAGMVLEGFFGWAPLYTDMVNACKTLSNPWPPGWVSSSKTYRIGPLGYRGTNSWYETAATMAAEGRETYACRVIVENPNLWVANKLGLVNLPGIAWDLVPWSFAVNAFSNMGQVMGSLTDFSGLALDGTSLTSKLLLRQSKTVSYRDPRPNARASASGTEEWKVRGRSVGVSPPPVTPYFRWPEWNVGMAAITGALLVQQTARLSWATRDLF